MLARVNQFVTDRVSILIRNRGAATDTFDDRRHFHEVGSSASNDDDFDILAHGSNGFSFETSSANLFEF